MHDQLWPGMRLCSKLMAEAFDQESLFSELVFQLLNHTVSMPVQGFPVESGV